VDSGTVPAVILHNLAAEASDLTVQAVGLLNLTAAEPCNVTAQAVELHILVDRVCAYLLQPIIEFIAMILYSQLAGAGIVKHAAAQIQPHTKMHTQCPKLPQPKQVIGT
jgi:hypothetical protein